MNVVIPLLIIAGLVLLNGLFVAAEFAFVGAPRATIERRAAEGDKRVLRIHQILHCPRSQDRYLATAQIGITIASLGLGMYGEEVVAGWLEAPFQHLGVLGQVATHGLASLIAVLVMTFVHIVVGEMVPKSLALQRAEHTAVLLSPVMHAIWIAFYPLVMFLNGIGNAILRLFGVERQHGSVEQYHTAEELSFIVQESLEGGRLGSESGKVLQELLDFSDLTAGELMVPRVHMVGIPLDASREEIVDLLVSAPHTRYPVYHENLDNIVGVLHVKDVLRLLTQRSGADSYPLRAVPYVPETARVDVVLTAMRNEHTQLAVILDEHGGTAGLVSMEDIFEEVVGEIEEEAEQPESWSDDDGRFHVAGTVRVEEVGEHFGAELEHEDVDTVSGLVLTLLDRPPVVGDTVSYDGVIFEVLAIEGHGVAECLVTPRPPDDEEGDSAD